MARFRKFIAAATLIAAFAEFNVLPVQAKIGEKAQAGDNCTPFNNYSIGIAAPGVDPYPATIVDQATILWKGWRVVGWILTLRDGRLLMVAYQPSPSDEPGAMYERGFIKLKSRSARDIRFAYGLLRKNAFQNGTARKSDFINPQFSLDTFVLSDCFKSAFTPKT